MKKYMKYLLIVLPYIFVWVYVMLIYKNITIITYLMAMIIPMIVSGIITGIASNKALFRQKANTVAFFCTIVYLLFFIIFIVFMEKYEVYEFLYTNSKYLFVEGFSIGNDFSANIFDAILPCCICYCFHRLCIKCFHKKK